MNLHVLDCLVDDYQNIISTLTLPDLDDRHVLAAAIQSSASIILTYNLKDFPSKTLRQYQLEAQHPDDFLLTLIESDTRKVCSVIQKLRTTLKNPPVDAEQYLFTLQKQDLPQIVIKLRTLIDLI